MKKKNKPFYVFTEGDLNFPPLKPIKIKECEKTYWKNVIGKCKKWSCKTNELMTDKIEVEITIKIK